MLMVCWPSSPRSALSNIQLWYCKQPDSRPVYHVEEAQRPPRFTMTAEETDRVRSQGSFFMVSYENDPKIVATGSYNDILKKENGLWKFTQRKIEFKPGPEISDVLHS
jgi:hypothetical protein